MKLPRFSIIVPTRGRPDSLETCLRALARLDYPRDRMEVVVVDDGSPVPVEPELRRRVSDLVDPAPGNDPGLVLRCIRQQPAGPAMARNAGARHAQGAFLAFTDDDCRPRPGWLRAFAETFDQAPDHLVGGRTVNALPDNPYAAASQRLVDFLYQYYDGQDGRTRLFTSNNMAVSGRAFAEVGGFATRFRRAGGEDREFVDRWVQARGATFVRQAVVEHAHDLTLPGFLRQHYTYGRGAYDFREARRVRSGRSVRLEPANFYLRLVSHRSTADSGRRPFGMALLALAQVANAAGYFSRRIGAVFGTD